MSNLSEKEVTAGISRKAIETLNSNGGRQASTSIASVSRWTPVIDTPWRRVDVIESLSGTVIIRETCWYEKTSGDIACHVTTMRLDYHECQALSRILDQLEPDDKLADSTKGRPAVRVRAI